MPVIGFETRWFSALLMLAACGEPARDSELVPGVDAGAPQDAAAAVPLDGALALEAGALDASAALDAQPHDAGALLDAASEHDAGAAACMVTSTTARCQTRSIEMIGDNTDVRRVYWNSPTSAAPAAGYPAVILYQGSFFGPAISWDVELARDTAFGGYYQVALIAKLLESGFVVIQPEASGGIFWSTNASAAYDSSADGLFIPLLLAELTQGTFGALDASRFYATGISSGGYMTSRMAVSYPGKFRALAIQSGSYATCLGPLCTIPQQLPTDHPPTLLLHGGADATVPIGTARDYEAKLKSSGLEVTFVEDSAAGHQWLSSAPEQITQWFMAH